MKILLLPLFLVAFINSCQWRAHPEDTASNDSQKKNQTQHVDKQDICRKVLFTQLIDQKQWAEIYKVFPTPNQKPLSTQTIIEYIQGDFEVHDSIGKGIIGVPLEGNAVNLNSQYATVTKAGGNYLITLKDDHLEYLIRQNFDEFSTLQFKSPYDTQFQDLCADSHIRYLDTIKLVFFRSAANIYMYDLKERGHL